MTDGHDPDPVPDPILDPVVEVLMAFLRASVSPEESDQGATLGDWARRLIEVAPRERQREHIAELSRGERMGLLSWLQAPNGGCTLGQPGVTFEAVEGGGILVRTRPRAAEVTP